MNEDAYKILDYLPFLPKTTQEQEYIDFLWDSFKSNYENEKYQFAFIAYHMLFMNAVYFLIWKLKHHKLEDFKKALIGFSKDIEKDFLNATSPFAFSNEMIKESQIFRFLKLLNCDNSKIGTYVKIVRDRNSVAHSNGNIYFNTQQSADEKINEILRCIKEINDCGKHIILAVFIEFLERNWNSEEWEFSELKVQVEQILIKNNYLSKEDIKYCLTYNINQLLRNPNFNDINLFFDSIKIEYNKIN